MSNDWKALPSGDFIYSISQSEKVTMGGKIYLRKARRNIKRVERMIKIKSIIKSV